MPETDYGDLVDQASEAAALRLQRGVKQPGTLTRTSSRYSDVGPVIKALVPQTPLDFALLAAGPLGKVGGKLAAGAGITLGEILSGVDEAQAGPAAAVKRIFRMSERAPPGGGVVPGIYKRPDVIAQEAAARVAPEHPALKELFGVNREDLYDIGQQGRRQGNMPPSILTRANPKGSYVAEGIMTPENERRILNAMGEAEKYPQLTHPMDAWYVMDPAYQRLAQMYGSQEAQRLYRRFNTIVPMHSPASDVMKEINRGTAANMMAQRGEFQKFLDYAGVAQKDRAAMADFPPELREVWGHLAHTTAHGGPVARYLESGAVDMTSPKVPLYMQASGVPEVGFQTSLPVPDAHFAKSLGAADVRQSSPAQRGTSLKLPEYAPIGPWYREKIAEPLGIEAVPAQGRQWGLFGPQTGVTTELGQPKLELLAQSIWERAKKRGIDPKVLRDAVLSGTAHASWMLPAIASTLAMGPGGEQPAE